VNLFHSLGGKREEKRRDHYWSSPWIQVSARFHMKGKEDTLFPAGKEEGGKTAEELTAAPENRRA